MHEEVYVSTIANPKKIGTPKPRKQKQMTEEETERNLKTILYLQTVPLSFNQGRLINHFPYKRQRNTQNCTKFAPPFKATTTVSKPKTVKIKVTLKRKK